MKLIDQLLSLCLAYCEVKNLSRSRVSTLLFGDGKIIDRLAAGSEITVGRLEGAMEQISSNWPEGVDWPDGIARPLVPPPAATPATAPSNSEAA